jgi:hypothetical protein
LELEHEILPYFAFQCILDLMGCFHQGQRVPKLFMSDLSNQFTVDFLQQFVLLTLVKDIGGDFFVLFLQFRGEPLFFQQ